MLSQKIAFLRQPQHADAICGIVRGIERETLRVQPNGAISRQPHPKVFGSALTHPYITTDYSEALLEFITPASRDVDKTLEQLTDIHAYVVKNLGDEYLWPLSMPCYISHQDDIQLADYGSSNIGQMKHLYRRGLKYRYGSYMQVISGIHFNLSFPDSLWQSLAEYEGLEGSSQAFQSSQYLGLIRNFKRYVWLLTYLYGASPALCGSFIGERAANYPFEKIGKGGLYLPYATSLRLSDLGYTSNAQSQLNISYNHLDEYVSGLRQAIKTPVEQYNIGEDQADIHAQLNTNLLQIENEYYSPVRPKRTTDSNEKPTDALAQRGIEYVEIRSMDINPFSPVGIEKSQIYFLDLLLTYCLLQHSPLFDEAENDQNAENLNSVILTGRKPGLELNRHGTMVPMQQWALDIVDELAVVARWLDEVTGDDRYKDVLEQQRQAVLDPSLTLSARFLSEMQNEGIGTGLWGLKQAKANKQALLCHQPQLFDTAMFAAETRASVAAQQEIETNDRVDFETFLAKYFA